MKVGWRNCELYFGRAPKTLYYSGDSRSQLILGGAALQRCGNGLTPVPALAAAVRPSRRRIRLHDRTLPSAFRVEHSAAETRRIRAVVRVGWRGSGFAARGTDCELDFLDARLEQVPPVGGAPRRSTARRAQPDRTWSRCKRSSRTQSLASTRSRALATIRVRSEPPPQPAVQRRTRAHPVALRRQADS